MRLLIYQIAAFTDTLFSGNPAAICLLACGVTDKLLVSSAGADLEKPRRRLP
jgi:predicted PhzF superfamily epimerase YddE/YHI9